MASPGGPTILADGLRKRYGPTNALDGFDLQVERGSVTGLLGPNGAGKTTAVRVFTTLLRPDGGRALIDGLDVVRQADLVRYRIGLVGQQAAVDEVISGRQNLVMFGRLFHLPARDARRRADELLEQFGLADTGSKQVKRYSGGMRRRLDLAASLILAPSVMFLDEPTIGLDPRGRSEVWDAIRGLVRGGTTILLTTQYLDEADQLADRISVMDAGRVIAEGTPDELKSRIGGDRVDVVVTQREDLPRAASVLANLTGLRPEIDADARRVSAPAANRLAVLTGAVRAIDDAGLSVDDVAVRRPTLDDVFIQLTGHHAEEREPDATEPAAAPTTEKEVAA
jgi:ABC-2 type transport system ATP-binding protein